MMGGASGDAVMSVTTFSLVASVATLLVAGVAEAQELSGRLVQGDGVTPARAVLVRVERVGDSTMVASALATADGTFRMAVGTDSLRVLVLRVGFLPQRLGEMRLRDGERRQLSAVLVDAPVDLPRVVSTGAGGCRERNGAENGGAALILSQALIALRTARAAEGDTAISLRLRTTREVWPPGEERLLEIVRREHLTGVASLAFSTSEDLYEAGFVQANSQGTVVYRAPSLEFFLDERFTKEYCIFRSSRADLPSDVIAVGFRPVRARRGIVQIEGELIVRSADVRLDRLWFKYSGLPGLEASVAPGGWMEFTQLDFGVWLMTRWELRMPRVGTTVALRRRDMQRFEAREITEIHTVAGRVIAADHDGSMIFSSAPIDSLDQDGQLVPVQDVPIARAGMCQSVRGTVTVFGAVHWDERSASDARTARIAWREQGGTAPVAHAEVAEDGGFRMCGLPFDRPVEVTVNVGDAADQRLLLRIPYGQGTARLLLTIQERSGDRFP